MTPPELPTAIVDAHHHLWALEGAHYRWLQEDYAPERFILGAYEPLCRDYRPADFRADWQGMPVVASVHVEAERDRGEALAETQWLHQQHAAHGLPGAIVAWADLLAPDADAQLAAQAAMPLVRGIRCKPATAAAPGAALPAAGSLQDPRWPAALQRLAAHGLLWDLRVPYWHLEEAAALLAQVPPLTVVLEHTGLPWDRSATGLASWRRGMAALAALPQVHVKISELGLRERPWTEADNLPVMRETLDLFGWQRCLFGSNFPVARLRIGYAELVQATARALAHLPAAARQAVWHDNAMAVYRIARSAAA